MVGVHINSEKLEGYRLSNPRNFDKDKIIVSCPSLSLHQNRGLLSKQSERGEGHQRNDQLLNKSSRRVTQCKEKDHLRENAAGNDKLLEKLWR